MEIEGYHQTTFLIRRHSKCLEKNVQGFLYDNNFYKESRIKVVLKLDF